jgi:hypothetical protein
VFFACDFGSDVRLDAGTLSSQMEAWRAINPIAVEQRHSPHMECGAGRDQVLRQGSAFEEAESRTRVKLNVH